MLAAGASALLLAAGFLLISTGMLTIDTGWGRRTRALGPLVVRIPAPREVVFDLLTVPYLSARPPRAWSEKIEVLERGADMVLAAHRTPVGLLTTVTVETVTFRRPDRVGFRLLRGPVPYVTEQFELREPEDGTTELEYTGVLGTDGWALGAAWGDLVARKWESTVASSLAGLKDAAARAYSAR
ncbi:MAG: SRPBCC family protein [Candidatus Limnocylindria bacterium]